MFNQVKNIESHPLNPIEEIFQKNMKSSFLEFEKHFEYLKDRNEVLKNKLKGQGLSPVELENKTRELDLNFSKSIDMIVEAYDRHMKSVAPPPELLPVRVFIKAPKKNLTIDAHIPRTHTVRDLEQIIVEHYTANGDPVSEISKESYLLHNALHENSEIVRLDNGPIGAYNIIHGSTIYFDGNIVLKSDAPKICFTKNFVKGKGMKTNYYHCSVCNLNWICEPCAQACHKNHASSIAIPNHEATWACCNCVKKGTCVIPNKNTN